MDQYSAANVEMAVHQFYYQGASQECHQWLTNAQMSSNAWNFAFELVSPEKKPEVQFFGASTIAIKVSRFWHEVPAEQYNALRKRVMEMLTTYKGPHIVQTRLCVALASIMIQSIPEHWSSPVPEVINVLKNAGSTALLFEMLTVIPEEFSTQVSTQYKLMLLVRNIKVKHG